MASPIAVTLEDLRFETPGLPVSKIFHCQGQLDESNIDAQAAVITDVMTAMDKGAYAVLDLGQLTYMNSKSVGYVTFWHVKLQHRGGEIVIAAAPQNILDILNVVGLTQIIRTFASVDEAKQYIAGKYT